MKKSLLFALFLSFTLVLQAQIAPLIDLFEPIGNVEYTIGADVDGDGDIDVICATNERLFWLEQLEAGQFSKQRLISTVATSYRALASDDVDGDGDPDLIYAANDDGLGIYLNLGNGEFDQGTALYTPGSVIDCYLADFNSDDDLDIVACTNSEVRWLAGNGNGGFGTPRLISDQHSLTLSVHAEDLDNDGDQDVLVAAQNSDRLAWHANDGNGIFADYQVVEDGHNGPAGVSTGDFDGDGLPDIIAAFRLEEETIGAGLVWYRNQGGGSFSRMDTLMAGGWQDFVQVADMDGDGDMDIVSCHGLDEMSWLSNDGNGDFSAAIELERYAAYIQSVELPDLNGDGLPDPLYGISNISPTKESFLWRASTGGGNFAPPEFVTLGASNLSRPVLADMDLDGQLDVIAGVAGSDALVWLRKEGMAFSQPRLIARRHNYDPGSIAVADLNGDGYPDVLAGSIQDNATNRSVFCVYSQNGDGTFTAGTPFETFYSRHRDLELIDMDDDGDLDMLYGDPGVNQTFPGNVRWLRNAGDGTWSEPIDILIGGINILDVMTTDFDEDGHLDLIICQQGTPSIIHLEHTGNGNYTSASTITTNLDRAMYAQAGDVDGDGLLDLIASHGNNSSIPPEIAWWRNLGAGTFGPQQTIFSGGVPLETFSFADFDLDGHYDILAGTYLSDAPMQWLHGLPNGNFADPEPIPTTPNTVRGFILADIDSDGDLDIIGNGIDPSSPGSTDRLFVAPNLANDESISGLLFYDENANGEQDTGETGIGRAPINVSPDALAVFSDDEGHFTIYGASGTYTITPDLEECFTLTTDPEAYEVTFDGTATIDSLRFGVTANTETPEAAVTLASAPTRCGFTIPFWLNYRNDGCWPFNGEVYLVLDELVTFVSAIPEPTNSVGDTLFWSFTDLPPGASRSVEVMMTIAGVEFLGSTIAMPTGLVPQNNNGTPLETITFDFYSIINCAYDPNDKQVYPNRAEQPPFTENYTLFDETLLYTLRFQNTGTDTAFNIVLRDQLSTDLDWSTLQPSSSSHPYEATLHEDGLLEFHFRNILLPDSTTNEPRSHGFVQFEINALSDLAEGTAIENTAGIYFDFNPPIITNTVNSMLVTALPNFTPAAAYNYTTAMLEVAFTDASSNDPTTWLWDFGDGTTSTEQHPFHVYTAAGAYTVCLTAANDWGSTQYCEEVSVVLTSTEHPFADTRIHLHPNPAQHTVWINCSGEAFPQQLTLYSAAGQQLQTIQLTERNTEWDISFLPPGSYWVRTETGNNLSLIIME